MKRHQTDEFERLNNIAEKVRKVKVAILEASFFDDELESDPLLAHKFEALKKYTGSAKIETARFGK